MPPLSLYLVSRLIAESLLAHELTHAIQQGKCSQDVPAKLDMAGSGSSTEREARAASRTVTYPQSPLTISNRPVQVARDDYDAGAEEPEDAGVSVPGAGSAGVQTVAVSSIWRISAPTSPGWESVRPTYLILSSGEPFELPHFLKVREEETSGREKNVTVLEGRYRGKDAYVDTSALASPASPTGAAAAKFDIAKKQFWYGGNGPIAAYTSPGNPVPKGKHDIEIPDYSHESGAKYGDFCTTWFRVGHSGDRYLHPGRVSAGCVTVKDMPQWINIWRYLIKARKDNQSVGEIQVI